NRENKIGALLRQKIQPRLRTFQKSLAEWASGADRDFRLDDVVAGAERVGLRIYEADHALALVRLEIVPAQRSRQHRGYRQHQHRAQIQAAHENQRNGDQHEYQSRAEVGLLEHECRGDAEQDERDDQMAQAPSPFRRLLTQITHHHEHDGELGQLGGFEMEGAQIDPSARSAGGVAGDHYGDQESDHHHIKWVGVGLQSSIVDKDRDEHRDCAGRDPNQLANYQRVPRAMRTRIRRADDADQPDSGQPKNQDEERPVEMKYEPAIAARHQGRTPVIEMARRLRARALFQVWAGED